MPHRGRDGGLPTWRVCRFRPCGSLAATLARPAWPSRTPQEGCNARGRISLGRHWAHPLLLHRLSTPTKSLAGWPWAVLPPPGLRSSRHVLLLEAAGHVVPVVRHQCAGPLTKAGGRALAPVIRHPPTFCPADPGQPGGASERRAAAPRQYSPHGARDRAHQAGNGCVAPPPTPGTAACAPGCTPLLAAAPQPCRLALP